MKALQVTAVGLLASFAVTSGSNGFAQLPTVKQERLGVDLLSLKSGTKLYGFSLGNDPKGNVRFAVERKWLEATHPDFYREQRELEVKALIAEKKILVERVTAWMKEREESERLVRFLQQELFQLEDDLQDQDALKSAASRFMVLEVARDELRDLEMAYGPLRKIAGLAYQSGLENVITTPATLLKRRLESKGVDLKTALVDLSADLPKWAAQSEKEWAARMALFEFQMREPLEFQGKGTMLIRKGKDPKEQDLASLLPSLLSGGGGMDAVTQMGVELGLPEFQKFKTARKDNTWWKKVTSEAERDGFKGVLVSRLNQKLLSDNVTVDTHFFAMESKDEWFELFHASSTINTAQIDKDRMDRIREDPQVKGAIDMVASLPSWCRRSA